MCGKFIEKVSFFFFFPPLSFWWKTNQTFYFLDDLCFSINPATGERKKSFRKRKVWASFEYWLVYCFFLHSVYFPQELFLTFFFLCSSHRRAFCLPKMDGVKYVPWIFHLSTCVFMIFHHHSDGISIPAHFNGGSSNKT